MSVVSDATGNLYGTTQVGGMNGYGVVFKLAPSGAEIVLNSFTGGSDAASPKRAYWMKAAFSSAQRSASGDPGCKSGQWLRRVVFEFAS